jgi:nucleoside 2-deoxyribosyltransferase
MGKNNLKCYIIAPFYVITNPLLSILKEYNIEPIKPVVGYSLNIHEEVKRNIKKADFIIAIFNKEVPNVAYEIGLAQGLGKRIFVILPGEINPPTFLKDTLYIKSDLTNREAIRFALKPFIESLGLKTKKTEYKSYPHNLLKADLNKLLRDTKIIRESGNEHDLGILLKKVFADINASYFSSTSNNFRFDMGVWVDGLENIWGNPNILEIKYGNLSEERLTLAEKQLEKYMQVSNARGGFLLYLDKKGKRFPQESISYTNILRFEVSDLIKQLAEQPFYKIIIDKRNQFAHSGGS